VDSLYEFIFRNAAEGILIVNHYGELIHLNPAAVAMLEVSLETSLGRAPRDVFDGYPQLIRLLSLNGPRQMDVRLPGDRLATGIAERIEDKRVVLLHDVTVQRELESRREALAKIIAHDLRNPLNALAGYADLVGKMGTLNPQQEKFLTRIQQTTSKLYEMAVKLVDLAWLEAGMPLQHVPVEMASITRDVIQDLAGAAHHKQITIINSIPDELPTVMGDPQRLKQTIFNLLDNAIRYSHDGGNVVVHAWHQGNDVYYTVADQGIGISEDDLGKIWDRLWRSADERVREIPGGGIGLAFARSIIKRHGGSISVESDLNEGSTFTFSLPLTQGS
jgi:signal transduction histidine kinase